MKYVSDVQHIPSEHYEIIRRKIANGVTDLWFYLRAELGHVLRGLELLDGEEEERNRMTEEGDRQREEDDRPWEEEGKWPREEGDRQLEQEVERPQDKFPGRMSPVRAPNARPDKEGGPMRKSLQTPSLYGVKEMVSNLRRVLEDGADRQRYCRLRALPVLKTGNEQNIGFSG